MKLNFFKYRIPAFIFSFLIVLGSVFLFLKNSLNLGIDFKGGIMIEADFKETPNLIDLRNQLEGLSVGNIEIQEFGSSSNILIRIEKNSNEDDKQKELINKIQNELPNNIDYRRIEFVGLKVGKELQIVALKAILFSLIAMFAYIWFRFAGWQFGLGALIALMIGNISN